jgi:alkanesulfonate monooxygenase SsuD/methylene tetrahydromethanopterin reductase-like flavin-dependent oxidoreductase (luciferase family)
MAADRTSVCRLGSLVSNFVLNSPLRMARLATTLDAASGGRFELGLGLGSAPVCRAAEAVRDDGRALVERFEEGLSAVIELLEGRSVALQTVPTVAGLRGPESVRLQPLCLHRPRPPLIIGGHGPRVLDIAAKYADRWNAYYAPGGDTPGELVPALSQLVQRFEERCAAHGRQVERSILFDYAPSLQPANRRELAELVNRMSDLGFDECIVTAWPVPGDDRRAYELLEFINDDLPALRTG